MGPKALLHALPATQLVIDPLHDHMAQPREGADAWQVVDVAAQLGDEAAVDCPAPVAAHSTRSTAQGGVWVI
jgi:hypothetical protein